MEPMESILQLVELMESMVPMMEPMQLMMEPMAPMMEPMEPAPVRSACQCVKKHLSQMKTARKQEKERGVEKDAGFTKPCNVVRESAPA